ncbi:MAG: hypothetical protein RL154_993 [Pseudomonadota bacterium]|jgi:thiol-disulfide isomerase/thioredoxin
MKKLILALFAIFLLLGCEKREQNIKEQNLDLTLTTSKGAPINVAIHGDKFDFSGFEGKPLLVVFFATWCPPCKAEMPELAKLKTEFNGSVNILAVLVEKDKDPTELEAFIKEHKINFPVAVSHENFKLGSALGGVKGIPALFMFDANGSLAKIYPGAVPAELIADDFKKLLK